MKRKRAFVSVLLAMGVFCLPCSCTAGTSYYAKINVADLTGYRVVYTDEQIRAMEELILSIAEDVNGSSLPPTAQNEVVQITDACVRHMEERGVSEYDFEVFLDFVAAERDDVVDFLTKDSYAEDDRSTAVNFLGRTSAILGAGTTTLLAYDFTCVYFTYKYEDYMALYNEHGYAHQLRYATQWKERLDALEDIGEDNVSCILRVAISAVAAFSEDGVENLSSSLTGDVASLYLKATGDLLGRMTMNAGQWQNLFYLVAETESVPRVEALYETGASEKLSENLSAVIEIVAAHLKADCGVLADSLMDGTAAKFCGDFLALLTDGEWDTLDGLLLSCDDEEAYNAYLSGTDRLGEYEAYRDSVSEVGRRDLLECDEEDFWDFLELYVAGRSPFLAFALFEL